MCSGSLQTSDLSEGFVYSGLLALCVHLPCSEFSSESSVERTDSGLKAKLCLKRFPLLCRKSVSSSPRAQGVSLTKSRTLILIWVLVLNIYSAKYCPKYVHSDFDWIDKKSSFEFHKAFSRETTLSTAVITPGNCVIYPVIDH